MKKIALAPGVDLSYEFPELPRDANEPREADGKYKTPHRLLKPGEEITVDDKIADTLAALMGKRLVVKEA